MGKPTQLFILRHHFLPLIWCSSGPNKNKTSFCYLVKHAILIKQYRGLWFCLVFVVVFFSLIQLQENSKRWVKNNQKTLRCEEGFYVQKRELKAEELFHNLKLPYNPG